MDKDKETNISVYFNSACPVCAKGIETYQERLTSCPIDWKDIHTNEQHVGQIHKDVETVRKYLHVVDSSGNLHVGIDAFIALWRSSPENHWKATVMSFPLVNTLAGFCYTVFANLLYGWNRLCRRW